MIFNHSIKTELSKGNPDAYKEVFRLLYPRLKAYCRLFISDVGQVDDIIQESFIILWERRKLIKPDKSVESLIFVIIRNQCLNYLKKLKLKRKDIDINHVNIEDLQFLYQIDFTEKEDKSMEEMLISSFQNAVEELPEKMKIVFVKCKLEGKKQKDVAREMGISVKMVEKQISKAKFQIKEKILK